MRPVKCYGYYGITREYDSAGYCTSLTYVNLNDKPNNCSQEYATKICKRDNEGIIAGEFYYDVHGNPEKSSFSKYGQLYESEYSTPPEPLCPVLRATHSVERAIFLFR